MLYFDTAYFVILNLDYGAIFYGEEQISWKHMMQ